MLSSLYQVNANMASKTPVSRLQELSSKKKLSAPEYELIFNRLEGIDPKFTYKCTFDGFVCKSLFIKFKIFPISKIPANSSRIRTYQARC